MKGQALAEFAVVLPLLLFVVVGGLGLGLTMVHRMELQHAAQEVATEAARTSCSAALNRVDDLLGYQTQTATCDAVGRVVTVVLAHPFPALMPGLPDSVEVSARALTE